MAAVNQLSASQAGDNWLSSAKAYYLQILKHQGPVVQSMVSLTSLLRCQLVKFFMTLKPNTLIFFVEKMREAFALQKLLKFFIKKYWHI